MAALRLALGVGGAAGHIYRARATTGGQLTTSDSARFSLARPGEPSLGQINWPIGGAVN